MKFWPFKRRETDPTPEELPVPAHLKPFFVVNGEQSNAEQLTGDIRCTCGCMTFVASRSRDDDCLYHLNCDRCGQDVQLFDARVHGWDAVVCHMPGVFMNKGDVAERCEKCGGDRFSAFVWIEPASKEEFIACVEGELPDGEWVNAFTWFAAHLTCTCCSHRVRGWADIETA